MTLFPTYVNTFALAGVLQFLSLQVLYLLQAKIMLLRLSNMFCVVII